MKLDNKKLHWLLLGGLGLAVVVFVAVMFEGLSVLSAKSRQLVDLKVQSQTADAQLSNLEQAKQDVSKYSYFKTVAQTVIPNDKDQAQAVLELNQMASQSGITLQNITFPGSTLGGVTATTDSSVPASSTAVSQAAPVSGIPGLYALELTITANASPTLPLSQQITYPKILNFLSLLENSRRTAQITQVNITPATSGQSLNFSLVINVFIKP